MPFIDGTPIDVAIPISRPSVFLFERCAVFDRGKKKSALSLSIRAPERKRHPLFSYDHYR
jgi:hypothetical protein